MTRLEELRQRLAESKVKPGDILKKDGKRFLALFPFQLGVSWLLVPILDLEFPVHNKQVQLSIGVADVTMISTVPEEAVFAMEAAGKISEESRAFVAKVYRDTLNGKPSEEVLEHKDLLGGPMTHVTEEQMEMLKQAANDIREILNPEGNT